MRVGGGRPLPELKNTIYIFIFDGRKRCTSCPKEGEGGGGGVIRAMPERKHSFSRRCSLSVEDEEDEENAESFFMMLKKFVMMEKIPLKGV